jgi:DNA-binding MarR family transcriptional regulator
MDIMREVEQMRAAKQVMELFIRAARRYYTLEKMLACSGDRHGLHHSERHMLDLIGGNPDINVTEFARAAGVTKGAVSQVVNKLEAKGMVRRYKRGDNDKEVFIEPTVSGWDAYHRHQEKNVETLLPLMEELKGYPEDKIAFLIHMLSWIDGYLEESVRRMKGTV